MTNYSFFSCAFVGPLNKQMVLLSRWLNQSWERPIPRTVTIWIRQVLWYVNGLIFLPVFFPFPLSRAPLDPIETLISKVADYLMYWKNSSVENWLEKTTTTPNYATWNTNELFSVHALANAMSRFRLEFGVNEHFLKTSNCTRPSGLCNFAVFKKFYPCLRNTILHS